jgi:hypothetical protein
MNSQSALLLAATVGLATFAIGLWVFVGFGTRSKVFAMFLLVGASLAGALALHRYEFTETHKPDPKCDFASSRGDTGLNAFLRAEKNKGLDCKKWTKRHQSVWQDPAALIILFTGVGGGVVLGASALRWPRDPLRNTP